MSDLVKRLREMGGRLRPEAADRIEALEAALRTDAQYEQIMGKGGLFCNAPSHEPDFAKQLGNALAGLGQGRKVVKDAAAQIEKER
jgi:hypothetical protein